MTPEEKRIKYLFRQLQLLRDREAPLVKRAAIARRLEQEDAARLKAFYAELDRRHRNDR